MILPWLLQIMTQDGLKRIRRTDDLDVSLSMYLGRYLPRGSLKDP